MDCGCHRRRSEKRESEESSYESNVVLFVRMRRHRIAELILAVTVLMRNPLQNLQLPHLGM